MRPAIDRSTDGLSSRGGAASLCRDSHAVLQKRLRRGISALHHAAPRRSRVTMSPETYFEGDTVAADDESRIKRRKELAHAVALRAKAALRVDHALRAARCSLADFVPGAQRRPSRRPPQT
jgi:hypothetical protein